MSHPASGERTRQPGDVMRLVAQLESLHDGERAAAQLIACGSIAVGPLRKFLLEGRPRGTFEPRRWAVEALAALRQKDILMEFLRLPKSINDPVVRFGEDAVENAAARELSRWKTEDVFRFLMELAGDRLRPGVIEALGEFERPEAIPLFDRALEDDLCRTAAEQAFRNLGAAAVHALVLSATTPLPNDADETPSSLVRRRSVLALASEIGLAANSWLPLQTLMDDADPEIVTRSIMAGVPYMDAQAKLAASQRLIEVLPFVGWFLRDDIADTLRQLAPFSSEPIECAIAARMGRRLDSVLMTLMRARYHIARAAGERVREGA